MAEQNFEIVPVGIKYICDSCDDGEMEYTGNMLMTHPARFAHRCKKCNSDQSFLKKYPTIEYKTKEQHQ